MWRLRGVHAAHPCVPCAPLLLVAPHICSFSLACVPVEVPQPRALPPLLSPERPVKLTAGVALVWFPPDHLPHVSLHLRPARRTQGVEGKLFILPTQSVRTLTGPPPPNTGLPCAWSQSLPVNLSEGWTIQCKSHANPMQIPCKEARNLRKRR